MKRYITLSAILVLASVFMAPMASAQCPLTTLSGQTWSFHITDISFQPLAFQDIFVLGSAGEFTASIATNKAGNPIGWLTTLDTTSKNLGIYRQEQGYGEYQLLPDCSGGTLMFTSTLSRLGNFDFYFSAGKTEMYLIGIDAGTLKGGVAKLQ
jgi:hypothetical protein